MLLARNAVVDKGHRGRGERMLFCRFKGDLGGFEQDLKPVKPRPRKQQCLIAEFFVQGVIDIGQGFGVEIALGSSRKVS